ncbi:hypothetical protein [Streptomyces sp. NPDC019937]|uniref:hypothetical protein n=1 Tax=Streptomyces sp. NPDC019937 TaxID=3154787 RepID=UPI0034102804
MRERVLQADGQCDTGPSEAGAKTHINQIFAKTGSRDRSQAIVYAHRHAITAPEESHQ